MIPIKGVLSAGETHSTVPAGWTGTNYPGDIHVSADGRRLLVANQRSGSVVVFARNPSTVN